MLPSSTSYSSAFPFRSNDDPVIFTLYSDEDFNIDHDLIKWVKNNSDFSEMIEDMFEWNVMGTLSDGGRVFYIDDDKENVKEEIIDEIVKGENEYRVDAFENLSNEEIIVEEEETIEMSGVSLYEGCYDIEMKFIEEGLINYGVSEAYQFPENKQNRRENFSKDDPEKRIKESRKFNVQKAKDRKKAKKQSNSRSSRISKFNMDGTHENILF